MYHARRQLCAHVWRDLLFSLNCSVLKLQLDKPSLVLWGRQDRILEPAYALVSSLFQTFPQLLLINRA